MKKFVAINKKNWKMAYRMARTPDSYLADNVTAIDCGISLLILAIETLNKRNK